MVIFPGPKKEASEALQAPLFPPKHLFIWWEWGAGGHVGRLFYCSSEIPNLQELSRLTLASFETFYSHCLPLALRVTI